MFNTQVGDEVWLIEKGKRQTGFTVTKIGIKNKHGYPTDFQISKGQKKKTVSPWENVLIFPKATELPEFIKNYLSRYHNLRAVRASGNSVSPRFQFCCVKCGWKLHSKIVSIEQAEFRCTSSGFEEGKPDVEECHTDILCGCKNVSYHEPENTERFM